MASKKKRRSVLIGSCVMAALIVGASTFAWFTSSDEVTNRLTASADYGVTVTEDFTPPEDWVPGQTVTKAVGAVNTGNVDAFVRMWLEGEMKLVKEDKGVTCEGFENIGSLLSNVNDTTFNGVKLEKKDNVGNYYRVLGDDERKALQTGELVYANGSYTYNANQIQGSNKGDFHVYRNGKGAVKLVDADSFNPTGTGLYLFRRNYDLNNDGTVNTTTIEYSGYYYDGTTFYALKTKNDSTVSGGVSDKGDNVYVYGMTGVYGDNFDAKLADIKVFTAKETTLHNNDDLEWTYTEPNNETSSPFGTTNPYFKVTQKNVDSTLAINIELDNIGEGSNQWTHVLSSGTAKHTFYYNDDLENGAEASILVKNVQLDKGATQNDFIAFDFDLSVNLESIQVTKDSEGKESDEPVKAGWAATDGKPITAQKGTAAVADGEITLVEWSSIDN